MELLRKTVLKLQYILTNIGAIMVKLRININADNYDEATALNNQAPMSGVHYGYGVIQNPSVRGNASLHKDIDRFDRILVPDQKGGYVPLNKAEITKAGDNAIAKFLTNGNKNQSDKLVGLCQTVGTSLLYFSKPNFGIKVGENKYPSQISLGTKGSQQLIKVNDHQFRADYELTLYLFAAGEDTDTDHKYFYKNRQGEIKELPMEFLLEFNTAKPELDGCIKIGDFECFPLMQSRVSATINLSSENQPVTTVEYAFDTYSDDILYTGPTEDVGITLCDQAAVVSSQEIIPTLYNFSGAVIAQSNAALQILETIVKDFKLPENQHFNNEIDDFLKSENKTPGREIDLYSAFFMRWKQEYGYTPSSKDSVIGKLDAKKEYQQRVIKRIEQWEKVIMQCPVAGRPKMLQEMREDIAKLQKKSPAERIQGLFTQTDEVIQIQGGKPHQRGSIPKEIKTISLEEAQRRNQVPPKRSEAATKRDQQVALARDYMRTLAQRTAVPASPPAPPPRSPKSLANTNSAAQSTGSPVPPARPGALGTQPAAPSTPKRPGVTNDGHPAPPFAPLSGGKKAPPALRNGAPPPPPPQHLKPGHGGHPPNTSQT